MIVSRKDYCCCSHCNKYHRVRLKCCKCDIESWLCFLEEEVECGESECCNCLASTVYYSCSLDPQIEEWMCDNCFEGRTDGEKVEELERTLKKVISKLSKKTDSSLVKSLLQESEEHLFYITMKAKSESLMIGSEEDESSDEERERGGYKEDESSDDEDERYYNDEDEEKDVNDFIEYRVKDM